MRVLLFAMLPAALLACGPAGESPSAESRDVLRGCGARRPGNVLLVLLDDFGVDKLRIYGPHPPQPSTPNIDALAGRGLVFASAYGVPTCTPSRAALMTGRYTRRTGHGVVIAPGEGADEIPLGSVFVPEMLAGAEPPYQSSAVGKWHMASLRSPSGLRHPLLQGFGWYSGAFGNIGYPGTSGDYFSFEKDVNGALAVQSVYATTDTVDDAVARIKAMKPPWFLYVAFNAPHYPYHVPPAELRTGQIDDASPVPDRYDAMVEAADRELGRLLDGIPADQRARTTILLLGDNGTPAEAIRPPFRPRRAKQTLYEGGVHVPLIVSGPDVRDPGGRRSQLVHVVDVFPTIADLACVEVRHEIDGQSFLPALRDPGARTRSTVYAERFKPNGPPPYPIDERMIRDERWKLIRRRGQGDELFAMKPGALDEGANLLGPALEPAAEAAHRELSAELERLSETLTYEAPQSR